MNIREKQEIWEKEYLSPYASLSQNSLGRDREEPQCDLRPLYQRDRDRILHSKSFRRMKHKTQVFLGSLPDTSDPYTGGFSDCPNDCKSFADE